ncbi:MAG TPA: type VI secretion system contractile sheath large subunit [Longimicrobiales bacterium]|nr:type VI secretion system contractile sheath large subunit [Longimicrobiales bacterium]
MLSGSVLDRIVEGEEGEMGPDPLQAWVEDVVRPDLVEEPAPGERRQAARVDALLADGLKALLHDRRFQRLEALWRGVDFLVRRVETDARLGIWLVDVSKEALAADLAAADSGGGSAFARMVREGAGPQGDRWSVLAATWTVGSGAEDLVALRRTARVCAATGTAFLAGAEPALAGLPALAEADERGAWGEPERLWEAFRREPEAGSVGLLIPRFLLRLPWGSEHDPCTALDFEEIDGIPSPEDYLWGSPALAATLLLAGAFRKAEGLDLWRALELEVGGLPLHVHRESGQAVATPCTEVALTENAARRFMEGGLMPFVWPRGQDGIRLLRWQSVASPPTRIAGPWGDG